MKSAGMIATLAVLTTAVPVSAQQAAARRAAGWRDIQGFNIVLVVGETTTGSASNDDVPAGARRALNDMREFLPYKHYRVVDSQWTSCCSPDLVRIGMPIAGRLQGVNRRARGSSTVLLPSLYGFTLSVAETSDGNRIPVRFSLSLDDGVVTRSAQASTVDTSRQDRTAELQADIESMRQQIIEMQKRVEVGLTNPQELRPLKDRLAQLERRLAATASGSSGYGRGLRSWQRRNRAIDHRQQLHDGSRRDGRRRHVPSRRRQGTDRPGYRRAPLDFTVTLRRRGFVTICGWRSVPRRRRIPNP